MNNAIVQLKPRSKRNAPERHFCENCKDECSLEPSRDKKLAWCETEICVINGPNKGRMKTIVWCQPCSDATFGHATLEEFLQFAA